MRMQKSLERVIEEKIKLEAMIVEILDDAAYAERFISKPNNRRCPSMYKILDYCYDKKDLGFYDKPKLVLRATPRQMTRYSLALDLLLEIDRSISDNPREDRKILWLRANRFQWTKLGKMFGYHRTTIKRMYETILDKLSNKLKNNLYIYDKIFK
jgi:hypothetical protein